MLDNLQKRLTETIEAIGGRSRLTESSINEAMREVRLALLEADVAVPVVKSFLSKVRSKALGSRIAKNLNPGQQLVKIIQAELEALMGSQQARLNLAQQPPAIILLAGLQGTGKTTTAAKLARYLQEHEKKSVLLVSVDIYRAAAMEQLQLLAKTIPTDYFPGKPDSSPVAIAKSALKQAKKQFKDVVIIDTAGRLAIDEEMMAEIKALKRVLNPVETLFVVDAMMGQDAANTAKAFNDALSLTGVILTKMDSDTRGGAALSVRHITGKPIKLIGTGEATDALEVFHPERIASRILGMGDILSLIDQVEAKVDHKKAQRMLAKMEARQRFDLNDLRDQIQQMSQLGGMNSVLNKMPGMSGTLKMLEGRDMQGQFDRLEIIINSMTQAERRTPEILNGSRKRRITQGSGTTIQDLARLMKQYKNMAKVSKKMGGKGLKKMMSQLSTKVPGMDLNSLDLGGGQEPLKLDSSGLPRGSLKDN